MIRFIIRRVKGDIMSISLNDALKKCGYRENLSCKNVSNLVLEMQLKNGNESILYQNGVDEIQSTMKKTDDSNHSTLTASAIANKAKDSNVSLYMNTPDAYAEWLDEKYNIVSMSISKLNLNDENIVKMSKNTFLCAASGNSGYNGLYDTKKHFTLIGACEYRNGKFIVREYSSYDNTLDENGEYYVDFVGVDGYNWLDEDIYGTSFACPETVIMINQVYQLFYNKYKVMPTWKLVRNFMKRHCEKVYVETIDGKIVEPEYINGKSAQGGYGVFILPTDDKMDFFTNIKISDDTIASVYLNKDNSGVIFDSNMLEAYSIMDLIRVAYLIRRKMDMYRLTNWTIFGNRLSRQSEELLGRFVNNSHDMIDKIENGEM